MSKNESNRRWCSDCKHLEQKGGRRRRGFKMNIQIEFHWSNKSFYSTWDVCIDVIVCEMDFCVRVTLFFFSCHTLFKLYLNEIEMHNLDTVHLISPLSKPCMSKVYKGVRTLCEGCVGSKRHHSSLDLTLHTDCCPRLLSALINHCHAAFRHNYHFAQTHKQTLSSFTHWMLKPQSLAVWENWKWLTELDAHTTGRGWS